MRLIGEAFYGRQAAYREALAAAADERLAAALQRNVFAGASKRQPASELAVYVREATRRLAAQDGFERRQLPLPPPQKVISRARWMGIHQLRGPNGGPDALGASRSHSATCPRADGT